MALSFFGSLFLMAVPVIGIVAFFMLWPILQAGLLLGVKDLEEGKPLELKHLLAGFKSTPKPLVAIGGFSLLAAMITIWILTMGWGTEFDALLKLMASESSDVEAFKEASSNLIWPSIVGLLIFLPFTTAVWFAPALVIFDKVPPVAAMVLSFKASIRNMWPFLVYGMLYLLADLIVSYLLGIIIAIFSKLGGPAMGQTIATLLVFPVIFIFFVLLVGSIYSGYRDIFVSPEPESTTPDPVAD
ncbi:hypothetical protein EDC63_10413 [Sulfurirhabdus autotrophica]|uniref:Uncharacterized protein n=2 Tax=Sulfurirhabdus autotrophica TaxID=1706046 RepID=A0A4R3Y863_9PROT|nr:hypothetical protein EDC63_10413 [Sulfurirhabdus autotrophica]